MARDSDPPLLAYIHNARSYAEQTNALRSLKNDIVGHTRKKETWVALGALGPIVSILQSSRLPNKANGARTQPPAGSLALEEEENVRLQALQVLSSFANGMGIDLGENESCLLTVSRRPIIHRPPSCCRRPARPAGQYMPQHQPAAGGCDGTESLGKHD